MQTLLRSARVKAGIAVAILGLAIGAAPTALAQQPDAKPRVVVEPSDNLPPTATVTVQISGFEPKDAVFIQQCAQVEPGKFGCSMAGLEPLKLDEQGAGSADFDVQREFEAHDQNGDLIGTLDCRKVAIAPGCFVAVGTAEDGAGDAISFAPDK